MAVKKEVTSEAQIDKDSMTFGQYLNTLPKQKVRLYLPQDEVRKYESLTEQGKEVVWPSETIVLNGYRFHIRKGVEVEVPEPIAQIAKNAGLC